MANEPTIDVMNEAIAVFDGWLPNFGGEGSPYYSKATDFIPRFAMIVDMQYHTSWDWLVPVVEKIESIYDDFHGYFGVHISSNGCTIQGTKFNTTPDHEHYAYFNDVTHETKILATHYAVYQFIIWFKQKKQKDGNPVA